MDGRMFDFTPLDVSTLMQLLDVSAVLLMISLAFTVSFAAWTFVETFRDIYREWKEKRNGR